ncbi:VCBS repeat-containing protein [Streptomyces sp. Je 1-79]|uniref:FG-GAP repeat domain-containing protein n=1 Tax=Streptomyces sp. Je 1-79 TaxID=2943847 RepID=UPI0021A943CA|nr:VCBS repeat-containing protein [Streptomyces sp. Je 1-79]MCT4352381.1 VCBS repeat-containing protein [Streptomyces sp. Je 1-79]
MANSSGLNTTGILSRVTVAAITAALVATTTSAVAADQPKAAERAVAAPSASAFNTESAADAPINGLYGVTSGGDLYVYLPNGEGGLDSRLLNGYGWNYAKHMTQADHDADGSSDAIWSVTNGNLEHTAWGEDPVTIGGGWGIYNKVTSAGNLGGAGADDLLARDASGKLYLYLGYGNGKLTSRKLVGSGWGQYNQITGKGDLTNDGKADIVARDGSGNLYLYKGTGSSTTPFAGRVKIGSGWNMFNNLVSVGDIDFDGITDLVARDNAGALYLYKGTGNAASVFKPRVKIGTSGWNTYRLLF